MKKDDRLMLASQTIFYIMALVVIWNMLAPSDWRPLSEIGRKIWAMAGLGLYCVIMLERHRRREGGEDN